MKIGIYGGSFNPIHFGHTGLAQWVVNNTDLDEVWLMVSPNNPLKDSKILAPEQEQNVQPGMEYLMYPRPIFDDPSYKGSGKLKDKVAPGKLKGKVCFSQVRDPKFESELISKGYEVVDSLTKTTNYLIVPNLDVTSSKITKAKKYGEDVMSLEQAKLNLK